ncbi:hypothetical protein BGZ65_010763 [Modicella reniformis]|uniref:Uncharacterized protein n=1 Tax=Modicella reniformis TaxID=1440133 RepID=A0A9P6M1R0_9FUNG|nr:hypothetical protein BGZ65_010763 [Modicella reniformis]
MGTKPEHPATVSRVSTAVVTTAATTGASGVTAYLGDKDTIILDQHQKELRYHHTGTAGVATADTATITNKPTHPSSHQRCQHVSRRPHCSMTNKLKDTIDLKDGNLTFTDPKMLRPVTNKLAVPVASGGIAPVVNTHPIALALTAPITMATIDAAKPMATAAAVTCAATSAGALHAAHKDVNTIHNTNTTSHGIPPLTWRRFILPERMVFQFSIPKVAITSLRREFRLSGLNHKVSSNGTA